MGVGLGSAVGVAVGSGLRVGSGVGISVGSETGVGVGGIGVGVGGIGVGVGIPVGITILKSSNTWSPVLESTVTLDTAVVQPVDSVCGVFPEVVIRTSEFPADLRVTWLLDPELATTLLTTTGLGKVIVPCDPPLAI